MTRTVSSLRTRGADADGLPAPERERPDWGGTASAHGEASALAAPGPGPFLAEEGTSRERRRERERERVTWVFSICKANAFEAQNQVSSFCVELRAADGGCSRLVGGSNSRQDGVDRSRVREIGGRSNAPAPDCMSGSGRARARKE